MLCAKQYVHAGGDVRGGIGNCVLAVSVGECEDVSVQRD